MSARCAWLVRATARMVRHAQGMPCTTTETTMTDRAARAARNQERSLEAFVAEKARFDTMVAELQ